MELCGVIQAVAYGLDEAIGWLEKNGLLCGKTHDFKDHDSPPLRRGRSAALDG